MSGTARVRSLETIDGMAAALRRFHDEVSTALDELQMEIQRALAWIGSDLPSHWRAAERRGYDEVAATRVHLEQARTTKRIAEHDPACREEKKAYQQAQQRLQLVQTKIAGLRQWIHVVEKAVNEYRARSRPLSGWLESDFPRATAALNQMARALEAYLAVHAIDDAGPAIPTMTLDDGAPPATVAPPEAPASAPSEPSNDNKTVAPPPIADP